MIQLKDTRFENTADLLQAAIGVAQYYGFVSLDDIPRVPQNAVSRKEQKDIDIPIARREERALPAAARKLANCMRPLHGTILGWRIVPQSGSVPTHTLELHVSGISSVIAEALLIMIARAIAHDAGITNTSLAINSVGSPESSGRFVRDVGLYLRKHLESISPTLRMKATTDPIGTLIQLIEKGHPAVPRAPSPTEYLTEEERRRFWELLEYIESNGMMYELNGHILGSRACWSQTLFELSHTDRDSGLRIPYAFGGRYDPLMSRYARKPSTSVVISILVETKNKTEIIQRQQILPTLYFAQLGLEARRHGLKVIEMLRLAHIPLHHGVWLEKMNDQMTTASELKTPYILIMGHKEALEGTVLVREVSSNTQESVPLGQLTSYIKRHRISPLMAKV